MAIARPVLYLHDWWAGWGPWIGAIPACQEPCRAGIAGTGAAAGGLYPILVLLSMWDAADDMPWVAGWGGVSMAGGVDPDDCGDVVRAMW